MNNAHWNVTGVDQNGSYYGSYLTSPDYKDTKKARKVAAVTAVKRAAKKGVKFTVHSIRCVG